MFDRYIVTNNITEQFEVYGTSHGEEVKGKARLKVCKYCLGHINYREYATNPSSRNNIFDSFNLEEFFREYSTFFEQFPRGIWDRRGGYVEDWKKISLKYREKKRWCCENCKLNLSSNHHLLHVHHKNSNKTENGESNLQALCADCHRKQPNHDQMRVALHELETIQRLRHEQDIMGDNDNWEALLCYVDPPFHGLLCLYQSQKMRVLPKVGYDIRDADNNFVLQAALAWTEGRNKKSAVVRNDSEKNRLSSIGWMAKTLSEALKDQRGR